MIKVLFNAEPFGFGPSAAIVEIFKVLKSNFPDIFAGYIGSGHDLDLQKDLAYDDIFSSKEEGECIAYMKDYDIFITAMDRNMAYLAKKAGLVVIFYDALAWYWTDFRHMEYSDYYIYQSFLKEPHFPKNTPSFLVEIAPLGLDVTKKQTIKDTNDYALINFGGLQNFYWTPDVLSAYVRLVLDAVHPVLKRYFSEVVILSNSKIAQEFKEYGVKTVAPDIAKQLMSQSALTLATPGLGNIYDLANAGVNCLFLPPANDSQGQQLEILAQSGIINTSLDWGRWGCQINYFQEQAAVMNCIKEQITYRQSQTLETLLRTLFEDKKESNSISKLMDAFKHLRYNTLDKEITGIFANMLKENKHGA